MALKYKIGDRVRIKSLDWYNENKDEGGYINCGSRAFFTKMSDWCGKILTINRVVEEFKYYCVSECIFSWTDEMIEGLVEEETKPNAIEEAKTYWDSIKDAWICPEGYIFKDENGNVINATKIVLEKKKKEYPKTYEECAEVLGECAIMTHGYKRDVLNALQKLIVCRDAYWLIAREEMGLGKPWEPNWTSFEGYPAIYMYRYQITLSVAKNEHHFLVFPSEEMRNQFYENFKELIESVKELL